MASLLCWASAFPAVRVALHHFSPGSLALGRYLIASLALGIYCWRVGARLPARRDWPGVALTGFLAFTVYNLTFNYGETVVEAGTASFIVNTAPVFAMILAMIFLDEKIPARSWAGIALSFAGIALLTRGKDGWQFEPYSALLLVTALAASAATILQKKLLVRCTPLGLTVAAMWAGTAFLLGFAPTLGHELRAASPSALWCLFYLGLLPGAAAYALWGWTLSQMPVAKAVSFLYVIPPLATALAWSWLDEEPNSLALCGGALALAGVALANAGKRFAPHSQGDALG